MKIRIGTRGSRLALTQANEVKQRLLAADKNLHEEQIEIVPIKTSGDMNLDRNLAEIGGKGLFTKEIEESLISGSIDMAVHSMKDMPAFLPAGLTIAAILPREDVRDAFISNSYSSITKLPTGATIGSSSARRKAQILNMRPDLNIITFRGNVDTRLSKLNKGEADATLLAVAGLKRLKIPVTNYHLIETTEILPAIAQGAIGIETREGDNKILELVTKINDINSEICLRAERAFLETLEASCSTPIAALAEIKDKKLHFRALIAKPDGSKIERAEKEVEIGDAYKVGKEIAELLLNRVGKNFFN